MLLLLWLLLLTFSTFSYAATPKYVGIEANDTYIYETTYDEDTLEDYIEDFLEEVGFSESEIEDEIDLINMDEDAIKIKIVILDVDDDEKSPWGEDGVRIIYNYYIGYEDADEEWDLEKKDETWAIWDFDDEWYAWNILFFDWEHDIDDEDPEDSDLYTHLRGENPWFVSTKTKWGEVEEELEDYYDDDEHFDKASVKTEKGKNGFQMTLDDDEDDDFEEVKYIYEYDDNGVLMYYERLYDGDTIVKVETLQRKVTQFIDDNILWIVIGAIAIVAIIVVIIVLIKRR
jgi:hypothetical protein